MLGSIGRAHPATDDIGQKVQRYIDVDLLLADSSIETILDILLGCAGFVLIRCVP